MSVRLIRRWLQLAPAPGLPDQPAVVVRRYQVKTGLRVWFSNRLREYVIDTLSCKGNILTEAYSEKANPDSIWLLERWSSKALYEYNQDSAAARLLKSMARKSVSQTAPALFLEDLVPVMNRQDTLTDLTSGDPFPIMLLITLKDGYAEEFIRLNKTALPEILKEPGLIDFQLSQVINQPNGFVVHKKFADEEALRSHLNDPAVTPLISFLQNYSEISPYENGYHHLVALAPELRRRDE